MWEGQGGDRAQTKKPIIDGEKKDGEGHRKREKIRGARHCAKVVCTSRIARQNRGCKNAVRMWRGPGVLRAQELLSAKRESEKKKGHKTSFCFGRAKTDRTPSQEMRDPQGTTQGERVNGARECAKSRLFVRREISKGHNYM